MTKNLIDQSGQSQPGKDTDDSVNQAKRVATSRDNEYSDTDACNKICAQKLRKPKRKNKIDQQLSW